MNLNSRHPNDVSCHILQTSLEKHREKFNSPENIKASMERVDDLIKSSGTGKIDSTAWNCGLDDLDSIFQPESCSGVYEDCQNNEMTENGLQSIFIKRKKPKKVPDSNKFEIKSNPVVNPVPQDKPSPPKVVAETPRTLGFIPASNELRNQNMKKYGKPASPNSSPFQYGPKKTLGLSRQSNVRNAFVSPVLKDEVDNG